LSHRALAAQNSKLREAARPLLPNAKEWIQYLYRQEVRHWGYVCLCDAAAQETPPGRLDDFGATWSGVIRSFL